MRSIGFQIAPKTTSPPGDATISTGTRWARLEAIISVFDPSLRATARRLKVIGRTGTVEAQSCDIVPTSPHLLSPIHKFHCRTSRKLFNIAEGSIDHEMSIAPWSSPD